jgi:hypothetical protein
LLKHLLIVIDLMILKKDEPRVEKFVLNGRIELAFYVHTGSNLTTFGRLKDRTLSNRAFHRTTQRKYLEKFPDFLQDMYFPYLDSYEEVL